MRDRDDIDRLHDEIRELVDDLWQVPRFVVARRGFRPNVDCIRSEDPAELHVVMELPGVDPEQIKVIAADRVLVVVGERMLALVTVSNSDAEEPDWDDLYEIGTAAVVHKMIRVPDGSLRILVQGVGRIRIQRRVQDEPYLVGEFEEVPDIAEETPELEALTRSVQNEFSRLISQVPYLPAELELAAANVDDPSALSHLVASTLRLKTEDKQALLEEEDVAARLRAILAILSRELEVVELGSRIQSQVQSEMEKG